VTAVTVEELERVGRPVVGLLAELAAADDLITELVAENEELRSRLARDAPTSTAGRRGKVGA
jgi:hypothetical protein